MAVAYQRILLTLDGSPLAALAIPHAAALARAFSAEITVLRVIGDLHDRGLHHVPESLLAEVQAYTEALQERWIAEIARDQQAIVADLIAEGVQATAAVEQGDPADTILNYAAEHQSELIVMSTHGRTGVRRFLYGSVAEKVLQGAVCPVLLIRALAAPPAADGTDMQP